ncbi:MAG: hypothetical protein WC609_01635 [Candidatus Paceibacterota bacterium]|jgi:hypothetical protein
MEPEKKSNGALIGLIVIVIILILGGIYIAISNRSVIEKTVNSEINIESSPNTQNQGAALDSLDKEIQSTNTDLSIDVNNLK